MTFYLILILMSGTDSLLAKPLQSYRTYAECNAERARIQTEMDKTYAANKDYALVCLTPRVQA